MDAKPFPKQGRLDCPSVEDLKINVNCRDEIIPILVALRHIYSDTRLTDSILELVGADVNVVTDWKKTIFSWKTIRDNVCLLRPETIEAISHAIVDEGHKFSPDAAKVHRADSTVVDTNIHYPTESSLIYDGLRKVIELCCLLYGHW